MPQLRMHHPVSRPAARLWVAVIFCWFGLTPGMEAAEAPLWQQMQKAALWSPDLADVRRILDAGFDPNGSIGCGDWPPLLAAIQNRDAAMAELLLERGARVSGAAMLQACQTGDQDLTLMRLLVAHGGNVNARESYYTCLHVASHRGNRPLVRFLSSRPGIDLNVVCADGELDGTALMWALRLGHLEVAAILIAAGTDPAVQGSRGETAGSVIADRIAGLRRLEASLGASKSRRRRRGIEGWRASGAARPGVFPLRT